MQKNYKRFLSFLLAFVMVIALMPVRTLAAERNVQVDLTVTARYMTNRLSWAADGVEYRIERSEDNVTWEQIGSSAAGSWLDSNAGLGTQFYYRLATSDGTTAGVQGDVTGGCPEENRRPVLRGQ